MRRLRRRIEIVRHSRTPKLLTPNSQLLTEKRRLRRLFFLSLIFPLCPPHSQAVSSSSSFLARVISSRTTSRTCLPS